MTTQLKEPINITITNTDQAYAMWHFLNCPDQMLRGTYGKYTHPHLKDLPSSLPLTPPGWHALDAALMALGHDPRLPWADYCKPKPVLPVKAIGSHAVTYKDGAIHVGCQRVETADLTKLADFAKEQKA